MAMTFKERARAMKKAVYCRLGCSYICCIDVEFTHNCVEQNIAITSGNNSLEKVVYKPP